MSLNRNITIARSSGEIENDWTIQSFDGPLHFIVVKGEICKTVSRKDVFKLNPQFASLSELLEYAFPE